MKNKLFISLLFLISVNTMADVQSKVVCYFTEPFITVTIENSSDKIGNIGDKVIMSGADAETVSTIKNRVRDYQMINLKFNINEGSQANLDIDLSKIGNDGMSDEVYDYEGILTIDDGQKLFGGCNVEQ